MCYRAKQQNLFTLEFFSFTMRGVCGSMVCIDVFIYSTGVVDDPLNLLSPFPAASCLVQKRSAWL